MQKVEKVCVQIVQARFAFKTHVELLPENSFCNGDSPIPLFCEEGVAEDQVCLPISLADVFDFCNDVFCRPRAIWRSDSMWAIGAEFRTTPAGKHWKRVTRCPHRSADRVASTVEQVPGRESQTVQIVDCRAGERA